MTYVHIFLHAVVKYGPWVATILIPTLITAMSKMPKLAPEASFLTKALDVIKQVLYVLSASGYKDETRQMKAPIIHYTHKRPPVLPKSGPGCAALILILAAGAVLMGCKCFTPEHANDPGCVIVNQIVDCTKGSVQSEIPALRPVALEVIGKYTDQTTGEIDWGSAQSSLIAMGIRDGGCILAAIGADFLKSKGATPLMAAHHKSYHEGFHAMVHQKWGDVKFKVKASDGSVVLY